VDEAKGLVVVKMESWEQSRGVAEEIRKFREQGKPILYMDWPSPYEYQDPAPGLDQGVPLVW
jgi:hypothetical protein